MFAGRGHAKFSWCYAPDFSIAASAASTLCCYSYDPLKELLPFKSGFTAPEQNYEAVSQGSKTVAVPCGQGLKMAQKIQIKTRLCCLKRK